MTLDVYEAIFPEYNTGECLRAPMSFWSFSPIRRHLKQIYWDLRETLGCLRPITSIEAPEGTVIKRVPSSDDSFPFSEYEVAVFPDGSMISACQAAMPFYLAEYKKKWAGCPKRPEDAFVTGLWLPAENGFVPPR